MHTLARKLKSSVDQGQSCQTSIFRDGYAVKARCDPLLSETYLLMTAAIIQVSKSGMLAQQRLIQGCHWQAVVQDCPRVTHWKGSRLALTKTGLSKARCSTVVPKADMSIKLWFRGKTYPLMHTCNRPVVFRRFWGKETSSAVQDDPLIKPYSDPASSKANALTMCYARHPLISKPAIQCCPREIHWQGWAMTKHCPIYLLTKVVSSAAKGWQCWKQVATKMSNP